MMDSNFDMDLAIEQGCDEAQKFIDRLRKNKQTDMGDLRLLDAFLRQIPIPPIPDRAKGAQPLRDLGLGVPQVADIAIKHEHIMLRLNDGISDTSPEVIKEVKLLQQSLKDCGMLGANYTDGKFDIDTNDAVKLFQQKNL